MTKREIYAGVADKEDGLFDDESAFDVDLELQGGLDSGCHTKNDPRPERQWHREDVTQRKGAIGIKCNMTDVIHGRASENSDEYATLVVLLFRFDARNNSGNIARAEITIDFFGQDEEDPYSRPEVYDMSFNDALSLVERKQSESVTKEASGTAGLNAGQIAELSGTLKWEKTTAQDIESYTTIVGNTYRRRFNFGGDDQVNWILKENRNFNTGIPVAFRAGILLKRTDEAPFKCDVKITAKADFRSSLEDFFGRFKPNDDSVLFNPKAKVSTRRFAAVDPAKLDTENLCQFDLEAVSDVTFLRIQDGAVKRKDR
ncbi:hypothetical protein ONZ43_g788 [Nemania bipapillata]|uniref:Uncharacterized protein n=1 Tax=Nemania bipapillata TaxID=110536 RepID=A0ACC2J7B5_9PEZI|nr:hypothetical protein ONZ43_g788 [Nemania bipapillata]